EGGGEHVAGPDRDIGRVGGRLRPAGQRRLPDAVRPGGEVVKGVVAVETCGRGNQDGVIAGIEQLDGPAAEAALGAVLNPVAVDVVEDLAVDRTRVAAADDALDVEAKEGGTGVVGVERENAGVCGRGGGGHLDRERRRAADGDAGGERADQ